ncbi:MAG: hypothetical protein JXQ73_22555 [Phycisphaerae bacterium]|nr:hypothetical protein [Phycisphaerae bacterium]
MMAIFERGTGSVRLSCAAIMSFVGLFLSPAMGQQAAAPGNEAARSAHAPVYSSPQAIPDSRRVSYATELPRPSLAEQTSESGYEVSIDVQHEGKEDPRDRGIDLPIELEEAPPTEHKEFEVEITFDWATSSDGEDDSFENEFELNYGLFPNLEIGLSVPVEYGDGEVEGNGDLSLYAHYRFWKDEGWYPGFALRGIMRLPTGVESTGVDGTFIFILDKTFGQHRVTFNGELKTANGHNVEDLRGFQWALGVGYDHPILDDKTLFAADYFIKSSEEEGHGCINLLEIGVQREIAKHHILGAAVKVGLDDNEETPNFGVGVKYVFGMK